MNHSDSFAIRGHIVVPKRTGPTEIVENGYAVCVGGVSAGVFEALPGQYGSLPVRDYSNQFVFPGFVDLHVHAPQYTFRGVGMDSQLLEWLELNAFPEEGRYADISYADRAYGIFVDDLRASVTTRACVFGTVHADATLKLMERIEQSGIRAMVGKVSMDRNCPEFLAEGTALDVAANLRGWLGRSAKFKTVRPILTPRFIPSCTDETMRAISALQKEYGLPVQSHLSENLDEIAWVARLCPDSIDYADAYERFGLFGGDCPTVMAHCVYPSDREIGRYVERGIFVALCPESNANIASGIAPARKLLNAGVRVGLGSDVAGGSSLSMLDALRLSIQASKLYWRIFDQDSRPLTLDEALHAATAGGGAFFGKVGSFDRDYEFDAVVIGDARFPSPRDLPARERLERLIYLADDRDIGAKFVAGARLFDKRDGR